MDKAELAKLERYMRKVFANQTMRVVPRPKKSDSAEVYVGQGDTSEFIGVIFLDDEDGDRSYNFQMAILAEDLQG